MKARLTAWRAKHLHTALPTMAPLDGISGRLWDIAKSLFLINTLLDADINQLKEAILSIATEQSETKQDSIEGRLVAIIKEITDECGLDRFVDWYIRTSEIHKKLNDDMPDDKQYSSQWVGKKLKSMSIRHRTVIGRSEIQLTAKEYTTLLGQYGFNGRESTNPTETLQEQNQQNSASAGDVGSCRVSQQTRPGIFNNPEERQVYLSALKTIKQQNSDKSLEQMEQLAQQAVDQWRCDNDLPF